MKETSDNRFIVSIRVGPKGQTKILKEAREMFDIKEDNTIMVMGNDSRSGDGH